MAWGENNHWSTPAFLPPEIQFRLARPLDGRTIHQAGYTTQSWADFYRRWQQLLHHQQKGRAFFLLAWQEQQFLGGAQMRRYQPMAEIADVWVDPQWRGQRIGSALIQLLLGRATQLRYPAVEIGVTEDNPRARELYQRLGFVEDRQLSLPGGDTAVILRYYISQNEQSAV